MRRLAAHPFHERGRPVGEAFELRREAVPVERRCQEHRIGRNDLREHRVGVVAFLMADEMLNILLALEAADAAVDPQVGEVRRLDLMRAEPCGKRLEHQGGVAAARTAVDEKNLHAFFLCYQLPPKNPRKIWAALSRSSRSGCVSLSLRPASRSGLTVPPSMSVMR